jgi:hypothetical protein
MWYRVLTVNVGVSIEGSAVREASAEDDLTAT